MRRGARALTVRMAVPAEALARFPCLSVVVRMGVGYDRADRAACDARIVRVCNVPDRSGSGNSDGPTTGFSA